MAWVRKYIPGVLGALLIVAGVALLSVPVALIVAGVLVLVDQRLD